jgi:subtilase family serine protease
MTHSEIKPLSHTSRLASLVILAIAVLALGVGCSSDPVTGPSTVPPAQLQPMPNPNLQPLIVGEPDLIVSNINFSPGAPRAGDEITFWVFVKNTGDGPAAASRLRFKVGGESQPPIVDVPELGADEEYRYTRKVTLNVAQTFQATAWADDLDDVTESDEGNNTTARLFTVAP